MKDEDSCPFSQLFIVVMELFPFPSIIQLRSGGRMVANSWILSLKLKNLKRVSCFYCLKFALVSIRWEIFIYCSLVWLGVQMIFMQGLCCTWVGEAKACEASFTLELGIRLKSHLWKTPKLCSSNIHHQAYVAFWAENIFISVIQIFGAFVSEQF